MSIYPRRNAIVVFLEEPAPETMEAFEIRYGDALVFEDLDPGEPGR